MECAPAFNYARHPHVTSIIDDESIPAVYTNTKQKKALFESADLTLDLRYIAEKTIDEVDIPVVHLTTLDLSAKGHKGLAAQAFISLVEGQAVTFILRNPPGSTNAYAHPHVTPSKPQIQLSPEIPQSGIIQVPHAPGGAGEEHFRKIDAAISAERDTALVPRARPLDDPFLTKVPNSLFLFPVPCSFCTF